MDKKSILVVEDDADMNAIYAKILGEKYNVLISVNAEEARKELAENKVDLIILDLMLPGKSGKDFLITLKKDLKYNKIEVLIASIFSDLMKEVKAIYPNVTSISKPFGKGDLLDAVKGKLKEVN
jgi:DNA-binding response OmpR family regulator